MGTSGRTLPQIAALLESLVAELAAHAYDDTTEDEHRELRNAAAFVERGMRCVREAVILQSTPRDPSAQRVRIPMPPPLRPDLPRPTRDEVRAAAEEYARRAGVLKETGRDPDRDLGALVPYEFVCDMPPGVEYTTPALLMPCACVIERVLFDSPGSALQFVMLQIGSLMVPFPAKFAPMEGAGAYRLRNMKHGDALAMPGCPIRLTMKNPTRETIRLRAFVFARMAP